MSERVLSCQGLLDSSRSNQSKALAVRAKNAPTQSGGSIMEHTDRRATCRNFRQVHFVSSDHSERYLDMVQSPMEMPYE